MAMSDAERKRLSRQRQREAIEAQKLNAAAPADFVKASFADFIGDRMLELDENLDAFGVEVGGTPLNVEIQQFESQYDRDEPLTALQRAVGLVDVFLDAAGELSHMVNSFKLEEISRAIAEAEEASANLPRGDVSALRAAFAEIARLKAIQSDLRKPRRFTLLATTAKGE